MLLIGGRNGCQKAVDNVHTLNYKSRSDMWHESNALIRPRVGLVSVTLRLY